jgi:hypothetical protein
MNNDAIIELAKLMITAYQSINPPLLRRLEFSLNALPSTEEDLLLKFARTLLGGKPFRDHKRQ